MGTLGQHPGNTLSKASRAQRTTVSVQGLLPVRGSWAPDPERASLHKFCCWMPPHTWSSKAGLSASMEGGLSTAPFLWGPALGPLLTTQPQTQLSKHRHLTPGLGARPGEASHRRLYFNLPDVQLQPPLGLKRPLRASQIHVGVIRSDCLVKSPPFSPPRGRGRLTLRQQGPCALGPLSRDEGVVLARALQSPPAALAQVWEACSPPLRGRRLLPIPSHC